jgi:hypothetical protein
VEFNKIKGFLENLIVVAQDEMLALFSEFRISAPVNIDTIYAALKNEDINEKFKQRLFQVSQQAMKRDPKSLALSGGVNFLDNLGFDTGNAKFSGFTIPRGFQFNTSENKPLEAPQIAQTSQKKSGGLTWEKFKEGTNLFVSVLDSVKSRSGKETPKLQTNNNTNLAATPETEGFDFSFKNPVVIALAVVVILGVSAAIYKAIQAAKA